MTSTPQHWLSAVPRDWMITRLSHRYSQQLGKMLDRDAAEGSNQAPYLGNKDVRWDHVDVDDLSTMSFSPAERAKFSLEFGDLLVCEGGEVGRTAIWRNELEICFFQKAVHRLRPFDREQDHPRFLYYALYAAAHLGVFADQGNTSTIAHLTGEALKSQRFPFPAGTLQRRIAAFLDRRTAAIDALIEKKERMIELLDEKRAALVHRAVTKGLDPDVPMKDSGIPWIGEIPAHWEVKRLKQISPRITVGVVVNPSNYISHSGDIPFFYGANIQPGRFDVDNARRINKDSSDLLEKSRLETGDLVVVRVGEPGVTAAVPEELAGSNCASVVIVRRGAGFDSKWLEHLMNSGIGKVNVDLVAYGAAQKQFNVGHAVDFVFPVPPLHEQERIAAELDEQVARHRRQNVKRRLQIDRLKEYRQALITQAVTGQLEIPEAA